MGTLPTPLLHVQLGTEDQFPPGLREVGTRRLLIVVRRVRRLEFNRHGMALLLSAQAGFAVLQGAANYPTGSQPAAHCNHHRLTSAQPLSKPQ